MGRCGVSTASWWTLPGAAPRYATRRNPDNPTDGHRVQVIARALGTPFLPHQRYTSEVAGERNPDGSYVYPIVVKTVPRQSGKTTELRAVGTERGLATPNTGVFYTAQTGKDARERWQDLVATVKDSPLAELAVVRSAAGSERIVWPNGSTFRAFAPTPKSLHGYTPPLVMLDEAFAHDEQLGNDLMGAIGPAQITVRHRQLWIVSTAGTAESTFLHRWIEAGRAGAEGVALFDWGVPDGVDVYDASRWPEWHPGMVELEGTGEPLVTTDAMRAQAESLSRAEFTRAFGNRRTRTASHLISAEAWDQLAGQLRAPDQGTEVVYAWDVMHDRSAAALVAVWREAGQLRAVVVRTGPGMGWVAEAVTQLRGYGWREFAYATDGPGREVADELERQGLDGARLTPLGGREYADAWGFLVRHIAERTLTHDGSEQLATAAANVATRPTMDSAAPSRRNSAGDITPLVALMLGGYVIDHKPPPTPALSYRFGT
jgi:phage terminase large subunit-like protein